MNPGNSLHSMIVTIAITLLAGEARGTDLIFPGIQPKISAGAGQTVSRGPAALFYNPANLIFSKFIEPYADISFAKVSYQYQHTEVDTYDPAVIDVTAPPITIGIGFRPIPSFALGVAFFPTGSGAIQLIESVPIHLQGGVYKLSDVVNKQAGNKIAAGAAFRFAFPFTVGLGLIRTSEDTQTQIFPAESEDALFDAAYAGSANQFLVGMRSELFDRYLVLALSYRTAGEKKYKGDIITSLAPGVKNEFEGVGYAAGAIGFGAETRFSSFGLFFDFVRETWSGGRTVFKRGFGPEPEEYDFIDSNNFSLGLKWWVAPKHMLQVAFGSHGANMGDGSEVKASAELQDEGGSGVIGGPSFGSLEAIPRTIFSGGYRAKITGNGYLETGAHYQTGTRIVPEGFAQEGQYKLTVILLTIGLAYGF